MRNRIKTIVSVILCLAVLTVFPLGGVRIPARAATVNMTQAEALAWLQSKLWTTNNYDGSTNGVQCVDLARWYSATLGCDLGVCIYPTVQTGCAYSYATQPINTNYYTRYNNSEAPQPGDIFVWGANSYGAYGAGHVGVITGVDGGGYSYIDYTGSYSAERCGGHGSKKTYTYKQGQRNFTALIRPHFKAGSFVLDVNISLDGKAYDGGLDGVTFDVYVNNALAADNVKDFYASYAAGTTYRVEDIRVSGCMKNSGKQSFSGSLSANTAVTISAATAHTPETVPGFAASCTEPGLSDGEKCIVCGKTLTAQSATPALGHANTETTVPATCSTLQKIRTVCERCGERTEQTDPALFGEWTQSAPADAIEIRSKTQYRAAQRENEWKETGRGEILYVQNWPAGFLKTHALYSAYNKAPLTARTGETEKTEVEITPAGYIYWHWCYGTYAYGPINRKISSVQTGEFPTFHAFYSATDAPVTQSANARRLDNKPVCADTYWWIRDRVQVYSCKYTTYERVNTDGWAPFGDWQEEEIQPTEQLKVEQRTLYRAVTPREGLFAPHAWNDGEVTAPATCAAKGTKTFVCTACGETKNEAIEIDAKNHVGGTEVKNAAPATAGKDGYTGDICCKGCGAVLTKGKTVPKLPEPAFLPGDVNLDGRVTAADARLALRRAVGLETYAEDSVQFRAGDVTRDGRITAADARRILRGAVGLEDPSVW